MRHIVIPARYASARFPGKPLELLHGEPVILHVAKRAKKAVELGVADDMCVATDHAGIASCCEKAGYEVVMTSSKHASGTDRLAEVAKLQGWSHTDMVVNIQGDEPLVPIKLVAQVTELLAKKTDCVMATLCETLDFNSENTEALFHKSSIVKVVMSQTQEALYFSRTAIPFNRDEKLPQTAYRHLGIYAYRVNLLEDFVTWRMGSLEQLECLEQLRVLENGGRIAIDVALASLPAGVDTPADLAFLNSMDKNVFESYE